MMDVFSLGLTVVFFAPGDQPDDPVAQAKALGLD